MSGYLAGLGEQLAALGIRCPLEVIDSSGGVMTAAVAAARPVRTVESGGAAGVLAAAAIGRALGASEVISFDMGGTTAKTGIVRDGQPRVTHDFQVGGKGSFGGARAGTGVPIRTPVVDLAEVGAGGGSVAWVDRGGALRVGPHSAGATPGPACYPGGGAEPTVTDANLLLGYLDPAGLAGGLRLSVERAEAALAVVAAPLGLTVADAAGAVHEIANATMAAAIRMVTVQRGVDPRQFTLVAFGGAGPLHAARLADTSGIATVVVPWGAGVASALGLVESDPTVELVQTARTDLAAADPTALEQVFADVEARARAELAADHDRATVVTRAADLRYRGQAHQVTVTVPDGSLAAVGVGPLTTRFRDDYARAYGIQSAAPVELVNVRVRVVRHVAKPPAPAAAPVATTVAVPSGSRPVRFAGAETFAPTAVFDWPRLDPGAATTGPALLVGADTTVVVPPGAHARLDAARNVLLTMAGASPPAVR
jgi:N-methylhydantoinase A